MQTVLVNTLDDSIFEQLETFRATLSSPDGNGLVFALASQDTATVDIIDNDCKGIHFKILSLTSFLNTSRVPSNNGGAGEAPPPPPPPPKGLQDYELFRWQINIPYTNQV